MNGCELMFSSSLTKSRPPFSAFVDDAAVVAAGQAELRLGRRAEQRPAELVEALALDDDAGRRALERFQVGDRNAHVFQAQRLDRLEAEHVADDRRGEVRDRAGLEQIEVVGDVGEVLLLGLGARARCSAPGRRDRPWRDRARRRSGDRSRPRSRSRSTIRRRPRRPLRPRSTPSCGVMRNSATTSVSFGS